MTCISSKIASATLCDWNQVAALTCHSYAQSSADLGVKSPLATSPQRARPPDNLPHPQYPDLQNNLGGPPPPAASAKGATGGQDYPEVRASDGGAPNFQPMSNQLPGSGTSPTNPKPQMPGPPQYRQVLVWGKAFIKKPWESRELTPS